MKLLIVARHPSGGIRTYFRYVFQDPVMADMDVTLVTPDVGEREYFEKAFSTRAFRYIECGQSVKDLALAAWRAMRTHRPDLVHSHGYTAGIVSSLSAVVNRTPHILTSHDVFLDGQFQGYKGQLRQWGIGQALSMPTVLNPVGEDAKENLLGVYPRLKHRTRLHSIRNGIDTQLFKTEQRRNLRSELNLGSDVILLGFFGRFMAQKGFSLLRDAVASLNQNASGPRFEVVCFGWGGFIREEQAELQKRGIEQWFHFLPGTDDMAAALRGVDAAVMPSRWEACPLLPMEAMVAGTVVVASDCVGMREVTRNTPALTFRSGDLDALSGQLTQLSTDMERLKSDAESFRQEATERFDASVTAKAVHGLYMKTVG